jgi:hypothetical protein
VDGDFDEWPAVVARAIWNFPFLSYAYFILAEFSTANPALDKQFEIDRAGVVAIEAILEGVFEPFEREMRSAARIGSIQKRTMLTAIRCINHIAARTGITRICFIGRSMRIT